MFKRTMLSLAAVAISTFAAASAFAGGHTWLMNEIFSNASGTIQFIELRESLGGANETAVTGHVISTTTPPVHSYTMPGPNVTPPTGFKTLLFATPACAALPGFPTPNYVLPAGQVPFFNVVADTVAASGWGSFTYSAGGLPTDGVHSRGPGGAIACATPRNYAGTQITLNIGCTTPGDVNGSGLLDADDIAGFVRVKLGAPIGGDNVACAEYCTGSVASEVNAFVFDILN